MLLVEGVCEANRYDDYVFPRFSSTLKHFSGQNYEI
jgi:hypothetical protein